MEKMTIENVMLFNNETCSFSNSDITVEKGIIKKIEPNGNPNSNLFAVPGFINTHSHVAMSRFRGLLDDMDLNHFLEKTFKLDESRSEKDMYHSTLCGIYEMLNNGITSFFDLYYGEDVIYKACESMNIRSFLSWNTLDKQFSTQKGEPLDNARNFIREHKGKNTIIYPSVGIQGVYVASEETIKAANEISEKENTLLHMHVSETRKEVYNCLEKTGKRPVEYLSDLEVLSNRFNAAHCVWLTTREIALLGKSQTNISWNSVSNFKLGTGGIPPVPELISAGANVTIGTDSNGSNNGLNLLETAKLGSISIKNQRWDASHIKAVESFNMLTKNGGRATGVNKLGTLVEGAPADLNIIDSNHHSIQGNNPENFINHLVYSMNTSAIRDTIVAGKYIKKGFKMSSELEDKYEESLKILKEEFRI